MITPLYGASKGFVKTLKAVMKTLKAVIKLFEAPQKSVKIRI